MRDMFKLDFSNIRGDFFGGLTAGIVALPLALAFGAQTELGAIAGLYGAIDSLLTSVVADNITKTKHGSDQELIGQSIGNMGAALIAGLPGAGATMRTVINVQSGGKTKLSGVIAGLFLLAVIFTA